MKRLLRWFHRRDADRELADEMREHLDEKIDELMAGGMTRAAATAAAQRRFGNATSLTERSRDEWAYPRLENLLFDVRYALRTLAKNPMFAAVVVLPLALGIGANTAIFTVVEAALIRSLPYQSPDRLMHLFEVDPKAGPTPFEASYPDFLDWRTARRTFVDVAGYRGAGTLTLGGGDRPEQIAAAAATPNFFPLLGVKLAKGRSFEEAETVQGTPLVVILSDSLWRRRFHADPDIVGRRIPIQQRQLQVVGVLPASFHFATVGNTEIWFAVQPTRNQRERRYGHWLQAIARLRPGATPQQAQSEMNTIAARIKQIDPDHHATSSILATPLREIIVGQVRPVLLVLLGTIALVLLIACANVANLLLSRSASRQKELAVRGSLGASRGRLIQQLLTESLLLALFGGVLGLGIAHFGVRGLIGAIPQAMRDTMPFLSGLSLNWSMLAFTMAVSVLTGVLFGLAPALRLSREGWQGALKSGRGTSAGAHHHRLRRALLVAEVALSMVLLAAAGLMMKSTLRLLEVNPGFATGQLLSAQVALPGQRYMQPTDRLAYWERLLRDVESIPGVRGAGTTSVLPLTNGGNTGTMRVDKLGTNSPVYSSMIRTVSTGYFRTLGIPLVAGRMFDERDRQGATRVVMINARLAHDAFPKDDPVGQRVSFLWSGGPLEVAGVVGDENTDGLDSPIRPAVYFPMLQSADGYANLVVRTMGPPGAQAGALSARARAIDPDVPVFGIRTMEEVITDSPATFLRRYPAYLIGIFAGIALLMATIGTYGLVAYGVAQRRQEIGIRIALGAQRRNIFSLVIGQGMVLVVVGVAIGLGGAAVVTRALGKLLFGVKPLDPATFATVAAVLLGAALVASYIPALRATRVPPGVVLGSE